MTATSSAGRSFKVSWPREKGEDVNSEEATHAFLKAILRNKTSQAMIANMARDHRILRMQADTSVAGEAAHHKLEVAVHAAVENGFQELQKARPKIAAKADKKKVENHIVRLVLAAA